MLFLLLIGGAAGALEVHRLVQRRSVPAGDELQTLRQRERTLKQALQVRLAPPSGPPNLPASPAAGSTYAGGSMPVSRQTTMPRNSLRDCP